MRELPHARMAAHPAHRAAAGLLYDRQWAAADAGGAALTQARTPRLARIAPCIDLRAGTLTLRLLPPPLGAEAESALEPLQLPLEADAAVEAAEGGEREGALLRVCGSRRACARPAAAAAADAWLSAALRTPCRLVRGARAAPGAAAGGPAFANEGALLLVTAASVAALSAAVAARAAAEARAPPAAPLRADRFRPNLVLSGTAPYDEDRWGALATASCAALPLRVAGPCGRCAQVCADAATGLRDGREPLLTLSAERMRHGRPRFGVLLAPPAACDTPPRAPRAPAEAAADAEEDDAAWMAQRWACVLRLGDAVVPTAPPCARAGPRGRP
jgi:uncharacterized protein YcbX